MVTNLMGKGDEVIGAVIGIAAGVGLGLLGAAIINALTKTRCPNCKSYVDRNAPYCNECHVALRWK